MLDSKAVAATKQVNATTWALYIRGDYQENLGIWSFYKCLKSFKTEPEAMIYFKKTYPQGTLIPFEELTRA